MGIKSTQSLARLMGDKYSFSSISRRETGDLRISKDYLMDFCEALKLTALEREDLMTSARVNFLRPASRRLMGVEEWGRISLGATLHEAYAASVLDSNLQTYAYATHIFLSLGTVENAERSAKARVENAERALKQKERRFRFICHENALYFTVGNSEVMLEQLEKLLHFEDEPQVEFRILPKGTALQIPVNLDFDIINQQYCVCENRLDLSITDDPATLQRFQSDFELLWSHAVIGLRRNQIIERAMEHYRGMNGRQNTHKGYSLPPQAPAHV